MRPRFSAKEPTTTTVVDASDDLEAGLDDFPIDDDMDILQFLDDDDAPGGGAAYRVLPGGDENQADVA